MEIYAGIDRILGASRDTGAVRTGYLTDARRISYAAQAIGSRLTPRWKLERR